MKHLLTLLCAILCLAAAQAQSGDRAYVGQHIPVFAIKTKTALITRDSLKGKVCLINFFAIWCPPCMQELPVLQREVWAHYKDNKRFRLLVVGRDHTEEELDSFKKAKGYTLPIYPDKSQGAYGQFAAKYIPRSYLIDAEGQIVYASTGYTREEFDKMLARLRELLPE